LEPPITLSTTSSIVAPTPKQALMYQTIKSKKQSRHIPDLFCCIDGRKIPGINHQIIIAGNPLPGLENNRNHIQDRLAKQTFVFQSPPK